MTTLIPDPGGRMIDIDNYSDAELGAIFRQQIKARIAERIRQASPQVLALRAKAEAEAAGQIADQRVVLAETTPEDKAKIKQVAAILGISKKEARKLVNA